MPSHARWCTASRRPGLVSAYSVIQLVRASQERLHSVVVPCKDKDSLVEQKEAGLRSRRDRLRPNAHARACGFALLSHKEC